MREAHRTLIPIKLTLKLRPPPLDRFTKSPELIGLAVRATHAWHEWHPQAARVLLLGLCLQLEI